MSEWQARKSVFGEGRGGGGGGGGVPVVTCPHISQVSFDDDIDGSRRLPHGAQNTRVPREVVIGEDGEVSVEQYVVV